MLVWLFEKISVVFLGQKSDYTVNNFYDCGNLAFGKPVKLFVYYRTMI